MNELIKVSASGIRELGVVPTDPYEIADVIVEKGEESPINIKIHYEKCNITGIDSIHVDKVTGFEKDPKTSKFRMRGHLKLSTISGPYQVSGKVLLLPITGRGWSEIKFENVSLRVSLQTHVDTRNGKEFLIIDRVVVKMETEKLRIKLENLFNHKELSDGMNAILNDNDQLIFKELQVPLQNVLEKVARQIVAPVFNKFPYNEMFLDE
ncbi:protein takeout-like isoform X1 [Bradysia coprophila]|nr:protein takeout-like isoform X1 [Bradysia coprophila]